jgi:hypothetical protein
VNVAVTLFAAAMVTVQLVPLEVSQPVQAVRAEVLSGAAVRVTVAPPSKLALQVAPQAMPAGVEVTVPAPVPVAVTVRA